MTDVSKYNVQYRRSRLIIVKQLLGSCCSKCGYSNNWASLDVHHLKDKKFPLNTSTISAKSWNDILKEAEKCILLCRNCHLELHHPHLTIKEKQIHFGWDTTMDSVS